ncbi:MAG: RNA polymerase factor sigma-54 [Mizugakiibacter sp.]|uniref:RNA polymerase factor sigma-54 n=1 Tax=Mizugakiibacter sp. TaxID=1972610 RepID=UPI0031C02EEF|nr:RNA polymerase factor sigma-54 [Xanthomonadaceae bacterium]
MKPGLQLRLHQQLALTPQLQQAIRLLQLSQLELETELRQLVESNPILEFADEAGDDASAGADGAEPSADGGGDEAPAAAAESAPETAADSWDAEPDFGFEPSYAGGGAGSDDDALEPQDAAPVGLREHLQWQLNLTPMSERDRAIATALIDALDEDGYLREGLEPVAATLMPLFPVTMEEIEAVRHRVQRFDPVGVASLDLKDCLAVQLELLEPATEGRALAQQIVAGELELLAKQDLARLARRLRADDGDVAIAAALIRSLDPRPGAALNPAPIEYVAPDAYAWKVDGRWRVSLSPGSQPKLAVNQHYCSLIARARREDAAYLRGQLQEARWLLKSLKARADTLLKVAEAIVRAQSAFLEYGPEAMKPLVLREVAEQVGMHESTISRVTTRKYLHTPRGTFEFKYFFSSGVSTDDGGSASATAIQAMIRKLVADEDRRQPFSDQALAEELHRRGIQVARRTVAKYREALRIPSSGERVRAG